MELRQAAPKDAAAISAIYAPYVAGTPISFELEPPDATEMARRLDATLPRHPFIVAVERDRMLGYAYGSVHRTRAAYRWSVEVSVYVDAATHRSGVGRALYRALLDLLRAQGYRRAFAGITLPNTASVGFHEAMGFLPVGVFGRIGWKSGSWHDVGWWHLDLDGSGDPPAEPRRLDEIDPSLVAAILRGGSHGIIPETP